jgi:hypothetical protein
LVEETKEDAEDTLDCHARTDFLVLGPELLWEVLRDWEEGIVWWCFWGW